MSPSTRPTGLGRLTLPWLLVAAFFVGGVTTGGAVAAAMIRSDDIVDGQVKRPDLAGGAVNGAKVENGSLGRSELATPAWTLVAKAYENDEACGNGETARFCGSGPPDSTLNWRNIGGGWQPVRFRKDVTGDVVIEGVARGAFSFRTAFLLPEAYRPKSSHIFPVSCGNTNDPAQWVAGRVSVYADGRVHWEPGDTCNGYTYISFDGIRFATD